MRNSSYSYRSKKLPRVRSAGQRLCFIFAAASVATAGGAYGTVPFRGMPPANGGPDFGVEALHDDEDHLESNVGRHLLTVPSTLSLPQHDTNPTARQAELTAIQAQIANARRYYSYNGLPENKVEIPRGPLVIPGSLTQSMVGAEVADISLRATQGTSTLVGGLLLTGTVPVATMDDLKNMYTYFNSLLPVPLSVEKWNDDAQFADLRRTYLGHRLKRITAPLFDLGISADQLAQLLGNSATLEQTELYAIDLMDVAQYNAGDGRRTHAAGAQAMFGVGENDRFVVLGIKLSTGLVYTPFDTANEWTLAKMAFSTAELLWSSANHFMVTHLVAEPIRVEVMRHLSTSHPVHALLSHHMKNLFGNTIAGLVNLFTQGTGLDQISAWGAKGYLAYFDKLTRDRVDFANTFERDMETRGLNDLPNYRQRDDSRAVVQGMRSFVYRYLKTFYNKSASKDANVRADQEIQAWAQAVASTAPDGGNVLNFPAAFQTFDELVDTVTHIIYLVAIKHHAMNSDTGWHGFPLPGASLALWAPLPTEKGVAVNPRSFLPPTPQAIAAQVLIVGSFLRVLHREDSLLNSYDAGVLGEDAGHDVQKFKQSMDEVKTRIETREQSDNGLPYEILKPEHLPFFIWI